MKIIIDVFIPKVDGLAAYGAVPLSQLEKDNLEAILEKRRLYQEFMDIVKRLSENYNIRKISVEE